MDKITIKPPFWVIEDQEVDQTIRVLDLSQVSDGYHTIAELYAIIRAYETGNKSGQTKVRQVDGIKKGSGK